MHLSDAALGSVLDPAGGGAAGAAALAHAASCAACSQAITDARTADRDVAELLMALDHPFSVLQFSVIAECAAPDIGSRRTPEVMTGSMRLGKPSHQWASTLTAHLVRRSTIRWVAILLVATAIAAVGAMPRSPVRHLIASWSPPHDRSRATVPVASAPSIGAPRAVTTPRGVAIIARGPVVVTIRLPQADGAIRLATATTVDARGPRVSVLASGDGVTYLVSQDTIAIDNRAAPNLDYDVVLPPAVALPVVSIRAGGRVIFARHGAAVVTTGVRQSGGRYVIPLSIASAAASY